MAIKLPTKLYIGIHKYKIIWDKTRVLSSIAQCRGGCDQGTSTIAIDDKLSHSQKISTSMHEALHAGWDETALSGHDTINSYEETIISGLTPVLLDIIRNNPELVEFWQEDDDE